MALETFAVKAGLKSGPREMVPGSNGRGLDTFGVGAGLKSEPASNMPWSGGGSVDSFAVKADLSREPNKTYWGGEANLSKRAEKQSR